MEFQKKPHVKTFTLSNECSDESLQRPKEESTEEVDEEHFFGEHAYKETLEAAEPLEDSKYETATTNA